MPISQQLMEILACPQCKGEVRLVNDDAGIACDKCRLVFPIRDDIPVMLIDEATPLSD